MITSFISYRTGHYKLHYYESPTSLKFVMVTDTKTNNLRIVLHQIYVSLYVEYGRSFASGRKTMATIIDLGPVVKNPLSPIEHPGGMGVNCELFELGVEQFVVSCRGITNLANWLDVNRSLLRLRHFRTNIAFHDV